MFNKKSIFFNILSIIKNKTGIIMERNATAKKLDFIFISGVIYILLFILYFYLFEKALYCMILSLLSLLVILLIYFGIVKSKKEKNKINIKEQKHCNKIFFSLPYLSQIKQYNFIKNLFEKAGFVLTSKNNILTAEKNNIKRNIFFIFDKKADINTIYKCEQQRQDSSSKAFILLCQEIEEDAYSVLKNIDNDKNLIITKNNLYKIMKKYDFYPEILYTEKQNKKHIKQLFLYTFNRDRFKGYFILATIMFLFSFISPFKNYYLSFAAILFIFCLFTLFNGSKKSKKNDEDIMI